LEALASTGCSHLRAGEYLLALRETMSTTRLIEAWRSNQAINAKQDAEPIRVHIARAKGFWREKKAVRQVLGQAGDSPTASGFRADDF
jgi:hypothetical protein